MTAAIAAAICGAASAAPAQEPETVHVEFSMKSVGGLRIHYSGDEDRRRHERRITESIADVCNKTEHSELVWRFAGAPFDSGRRPALRIELQDQTENASDWFDPWQMQLTVRDAEGDQHPLGPRGIETVKPAAAPAPGLDELSETVATWFEDAFILDRESTDGAFLRDLLKKHAPVGKGGIVFRAEVDGAVWPIPDQIAGVLWLDWQEVEHWGLSQFRTLRMVCPRTESDLPSVNLRCLALNEPLELGDGESRRGLLLKHTHWGPIELNPPLREEQFRQLHPKGKVYYVRDASFGLSDY